MDIIDESIVIKDNSNNDLSYQFDNNSYYFDIESLENYFLLLAKNFKTNHVIKIELKEGQKLDYKNENWNNFINVLNGHYTIAYNSFSYDLNIIEFIINLIQSNTIIDAELIKNESNKLIMESDKRKKYNLKSSKREFSINKIRLANKYNKHVDLFNLLDPKSSLKKLSLNLSTKESNFYDFSNESKIKNDEIKSFVDYCLMDLKMTYDVFHKTEALKHIQIRIDHDVSISCREARFGKEYLLNKYKVEIYNLNKIGNANNKLMNNRIEIPTNIKKAVLESNNEINSKVIKTIEGWGFIKGESNLVLLIKSKTNTYTFKEGGLHSKKAFIFENPSVGDEYKLYNLDFASFYPLIMINYEMLGKTTSLYKEIVDERLIAKKNKDKIKADGLKIVINAIYGQLKFNESLIYKEVCIYGQLFTLLLIDKIEKLKESSILLANTDGIIIKTKASKEKLNEIIEYFKITFNQTLEIDEMSSIIIKDVSNYCYFDSKNNMKSSKGIFRMQSGVKNNKNGYIISKSIINYLRYNKSVIETIDEAIKENNIDPFLFILSCQKPNLFMEMESKKIIGRVIRFIYDQNGIILKKVKNNNNDKKPSKVLSDNKVNIVSNIENVDLKTINKDFYIKESHEIIEKFENTINKIKGKSNKKERVINC